MMTHGWSLSGENYVVLKAEPVEATISVEDVRRNFYDTFATGDRYYWWIREMFIDPSELIVQDDNDQLWRVPYEANDDGSVEYGDEQLVAIEYVDASGVDKDVVNLAAARAMRTVRGSENIAASYESRADSRPESGGSMDLNKLRQLLRLSADTPDEEVLRLAAERLGESDDDVEGEDGGEGADEAAESGEDAGDSEEDAPEPPPAPASASGVLVAPEALAQLQHDARMGREAREAQLSASVTDEVSSFVRDGVIPPAARANYLNLALAEAKAGRDDTLKFLRGLPKNTIPVELRSSQDTDPAQVDNGPIGYPAEWLPEVAARKAAAAGRSSRVMGDQRYAGVNT
jgi:hypothetical protein